MILHWQRRLPLEGLKLEWRGPNTLTSEYADVLFGSINAINSLEAIETRIAVITGPRGEDGEPGPPGPKGENGVVIVPEILDGGNF